MFDSLTSKLGEIFEGLTKRSTLSASDVDSALREIRVALLEADVALDVVKSFIETIRQRATGEKVLRSVTPGQMVIKLVHDHLVEILGGSGDVTDPNFVNADLENLKFFEFPLSSFR